MRNNRKERPGVMLYFEDIRPAINRLDPGQSGALLRSILDYAQYGEAPELDPMTSLVFEMLVPKIDRDAERYEENREQRQYAVYTREKKRNGESCLSFAEWRLMRSRSSEHENIGPISPDPKNIDPYPSATASTSATATTTASASASSLASTVTAGEGSKGEGDDEAHRLYASMLRAIGEGDIKKARAIKAKLNEIGYDTGGRRRERNGYALPPLPGT
ncbi:MAG: hypothetical protein II885_07245 [Oscillospiraceae bacterium]|nr:hypothetical protein [Oscillospiraceae bacterium]